MTSSIAFTRFVALCVLSTYPRTPACRALMMYGSSEYIVNRIDRVCGETWAISPAASGAPRCQRCVAARAIITSILFGIVLTVDDQSGTANQVYAPFSPWGVNEAQGKSLII